MWAIRLRTQYAQVTRRNNNKSRPTLLFFVYYYCVLLLVGCIMTCTCVMTQHGTLVSFSAPPSSLYDCRANIYNIEIVKTF